MKRAAGLVFAASVVVGCSSKKVGGGGNGSGSATGSAVVPKPGALSAGACKKAVVTMLAKTFTNRVSTDDERVEAQAYLEQACLEDGWNTRVEGCINGIGDP